MASEWIGVTEGLQFGGQVAWETAEERPAPQGSQWMVPLFVRLRPAAPGDAAALRAVIAQTLAHPDIVMAQDERDLLETEARLAMDGTPPPEVRAILWAPRAVLAQGSSLWQVLHVGPSSLFSGPAGGAAAMAPAPRDLRCQGGAVRAVPPVLAVVDNGIAFLNARFRAAPGQTRIRALWMQAHDRLAPDPAQGSPDVVCGQVIRADRIDALLRDSNDEAAIYRAMNRDLQRVGEVSPTSISVAHGTHVLDLAGGARPGTGDAMADLPILAVQLPPAAIAESAGRRLESCVVQALRWILAEVLRDAAGAAVPPVVINLSIGSLAGPGDETAFLADWMRHEVARHARMAPGAVVRIVCAYGNARRARLVARDAVNREAPLVLDWRVLPDDHTASFAELRVDTDKMRTLRIALEPPAGSGLPALDLPWLTAGTGRRLIAPGGMVAAITASAEGGRSLLHLALAPTAGGGALAPPGLWRIRLSTDGAGPVPVTARILRDDTPHGYRLLGRQSWFDHPEGWGWDDETRDYTCPQTGGDAVACPVTREGTAVAFAGADHPAILFVGAVRPVTGNPAAHLPSLYSAAGAVRLRGPDESDGPTLAALGDDGAFLTGRLAAGVASGAVTRMSGTSMAAPAVARRLLLHFAAVAAGTAPAGAKAERDALLGPVPVLSPPHPLTGQGVLVQAR